MADVVQPPDEGADDGGPGLGPKDGLVDGEAEGLVDADALTGKGGDGLDALDGAWNLDPGVGNPVGYVAASSTMPWVSVDTTSTEMGPSTKDAISATAER